jgi:hypothetical protein
MRDHLARENADLRLSLESREQDPADRARTNERLNERLGVLREDLESCVETREATVQDVRRLKRLLSERDYVFAEGDERCRAVHLSAGATCLLPKGHVGDHRNTQGYWMPREGEMFANDGGAK